MKRNENERKSGRERERNTIGAGDYEFLFASLFSSSSLPLSAEDKIITSAITHSLVSIVDVAVTECMCCLPN